MARVEHYFSDFIQAFSRGGGCIHGYARDGKQLELSKNVRFIGTCNADESTRAMSDRFLDRVNQLEFRLSEEDAKRLVGNAFDGIAAKPSQYQEGDAVPADVYLSWSSIKDGARLSSEIKDLYYQMRERLMGAKLLPSPRVIGELSKYIAMRPMFGCCNELDRQKLAFDEQISQRVLAKAQATPGTIAAFESLCSDCIEKGLLLSAATLKDRIEEYRRIMAV